LPKSATRLKRYHPAAFLTALLNNQPMGFWPPTVLVRDARRHGITVTPLDIEESEACSSLQGGAVRLGLTSVIGLGEQGVRRIVEARRARPFRDLADLCRRTRLACHLVESLIHAGACDRWGVTRRALLWQLGLLRYEVEELELPIAHDPIALPEQSPEEAHALQQRLLGVSTAEHPLARWRAALAARGYLSSTDLLAAEVGRRVRVLGTLILAQQPPTARGFMFLTLEDEAGMINVIVQPALVAGMRAQLEDGGMLEVEGIVQRDAGAVNLLALCCHKPRR
jgi:error-prone DNA polymerase